MLEEHLKEAGIIFARRICAFDAEQMGSLYCYLSELKAARMREDLEAIDGIREGLAELLAPEIIGDVKEWPPEDTP